MDTQYSSENQLRAKIEEPEGWISVYGGDGTKLLKREYSKGAGYHVDSKGMPIMDEEDEDTFVQWGSKKKDVEYLVRLARVLHPLALDAAEHRAHRWKRTRMATRSVQSTSISEPWRRHLLCCCRLGYGR